MGHFSLWICFHHAEKLAIQWAPCLDSKDEVACEIWQISGRQNELELNYISGSRPEKILNLQDKWLIKDGLAADEATTVREVASTQTVDNDADFWDCRIFCFEILAELEQKRILSPDDEKYVDVRRRLHNRWRNEDGAPEQTSDDSISEIHDQNETSKLVEDGPSCSDDKSDTTPGVDANSRKASGQSDIAGRKRALSHDSNGRGQVENLAKILQGNTNMKIAKRPKDD